MDFIHAVGHGLDKWVSPKHTHGSQDTSFGYIPHVTTQGKMEGKHCHIVQDVVCDASRNARFAGNDWLYYQGASLHVGNLMVQSGCCELQGNMTTDPESLFNVAYANTTRESPEMRDTVSQRCMETLERLKT